MGETKMPYESKIDELNAKARLSELRAEDEQREKEKKNHDFFMIFKKTGSPIIRDLIGVSPIGARIFIFLAEQADRTNAIVASGKALATALQVSEASVSRAIKTLEERNLLERMNSGGTNVFILNPEIVWSAWATGKDYCLFGNAKILMSASEQTRTIKKRLNVLMEDSRQPSLFDDLNAQDLDSVLSEEPSRTHED